MILISGANGQLGFAMAELLTRRDKTITALTRQQLDISDFQAVCDAFENLKPNLAINCAAYNNVDSAESDWKQALRVNALGVRNLAIACQERQIPLVSVSTDYVFDGEKKSPYTIADKPKPINTYGQTKLLGEQYLGCFTNRFYLIRTSWVFGRGSNFLKKILEYSADHCVLHIVHNQISAPTFAPDLAQAIWNLVQTGMYGFYHFHNAGQCSRYEWVRYAMEKIGWSGKIEPVASDFFPTPARRPAYSVLDLFPLDEMGITIASWEESTNRWLEEYR